MTGWSQWLQVVIACSSTQCLQWNGKECVSSHVRSESPGYFLLDFQFPYSPFAAVVVGWYHRVIHEIEDVMPNLYKSFAEPLKVTFKVSEIFLQQLVKSFKPGFFADYFPGLFIAFMYDLAKQVSHLHRPLLFLVKLREILQLSEQMCQAYLMVKEVYREIGTMTVCHSHHVAQRVSEPFLKDLGATPCGTKA